MYVKDYDDLVPGVTMRVSVEMIPKPMETKAQKEDLVGAVGALFIDKQIANQVDTDRALVLNNVLSMEINAPSCYTRSLVVAAVADQAMMNSIEAFRTVGYR